MNAAHLQEVFLGHLLKQKAPVTVFLTNGIKLQGIVTAFDEHSLLLRREAHAQLIYKHAISTIMPNTPISLVDEAEINPA